MKRMEVRHYPSMSRLMDEYHRIGGNQGGIMPGFFISVAEAPGEPLMRSLTASMPAYHRILLNEPELDMQYHLSGYGLYNEEALVKLMGESIERYAAVVAMRGYESDLRYASFDELSAEGRCLPLEYLALYDADQQARISRLMPRFADAHPSEDEVIAWIKCPSLVRPGEETWVPAQLFFLAFRASSEHGDRLYTPSFSTGTAAHVSTERALLNALIESVQIDAFILNWYTDAPAPRVLLDDERSQRLLAKLRLGPDSPYEVIPLYLTRPELPLPTFGIFLQRKTEQLPFITVGVQGDADPGYAMLRGTLESAAILGLGMYSAVFDTMKFHFAVNSSAYTDLDTNVLYFASPDDAQLKREIIQGRIDGEIPLSEVEPLCDPSADPLPALLKAVSQVSEWAVYLDITPPELDGTKWKVIRVLIPELCSMCLPGMPPKAHPRIRSYGGVINERPHPLP